MSYFQTKNPNLGKFWRVLQWKILVYFVAIWYTYYIATWYIFLRFGMLCQEKSVNPVIKLWVL
jgi:hypothetical protein